MSASTRLALALLVLPPAAATAATAAEIARPAQICDFRAWSKDPDPAGLNVRAAPKRDAAVVGRLPAPREVEGEKIAVEFKVVGGDGPWLLIDGAEFADYGTGAKKVFSGRGWVAAGLVGVTPQDEKVRSAPETTAGIVDEPRPTADGGTDFLSPTRILGCRGRWIEMEGEFRVEQQKPGRPVRGWVTDLCANQVTTCN